MIIMQRVHKGHQCPLLTAVNCCSMQPLLCMKGHIMFTAAVCNIVSVVYTATFFDFSASVRFCDLIS